MWQGHHLDHWLCCLSMEGSSGQLLSSDQLWECAQPQFWSWTWVLDPQSHPPCEFRESGWSVWLLCQAELQWLNLVQCQSGGLGVCQRKTKEAVWDHSSRKTGLVSVVPHLMAARKAWLLAHLDCRWSSKTCTWGAYRVVTLMWKLLMKLVIALRMSAWTSAYPQWMVTCNSQWSTSMSCYRPKQMFW